MRALATFFVVLSSLANAQTWQAAPTSPIQPGTMLLMRNGCVLAHEDETSNNAILCPDSVGSYANGTWTIAAPLPMGYGPRAYSSAVLPDGRVLFEGGEYNFGEQDWTSMGAIYDPLANTWTAVQPPQGWDHIGDGASVVLSNGVYYQANATTSQTAFFNAHTLTWTEGPRTLTTNNNEAGWALLPNGTVLEVNSEKACGSSKSSQIYDPGQNQWICGPELPQKLYSEDWDGELGSTVVTYNNSVIQYSGGRVIGTAVLDLGSDTWSVGPLPPTGYNQDDGPSSVEPNGKVLAMLANKLAPLTCQFTEYNPATNTLVASPNPPECPFGRAAVSSRLLVLPTGQILYSHFSHIMELYNPAGGFVQSAVPLIYLPSLTLYAGSTNNILYGVQLNGLSQANMYGDDVQMASNYPLVKLVDSHGNVWYARSHDDSYSGIAPGTISYTKFDVPAIPPGRYSLSVVTNGLPSNSVQVSVLQH